MGPYPDKQKNLSLYYVIEFWNPIYYLYHA